MNIDNELHRAERFLNAFNAIDKHMRDAVLANHKVSFSPVLSQFAHKNGWFKRRARGCTLFKMKPLPFSCSEPYCVLSFGVTYRQEIGVQKIDPVAQRFFQHWIISLQ